MPNFYQEFIRDFTNMEDLGEKEEDIEKLFEEKPPTLTLNSKSTKKATINFKSK